MFQFFLKSKRYGEKVVSIDDEDKQLLFTVNEKGETIHRYQWHIGYKNARKQFYAFRYVEETAENLSCFLTGKERNFFADNNCLNCCRNNMVSRSAKTQEYKSPHKQKLHYCLEVPEEIQQRHDLYMKAVNTPKPEEIDPFAPNDKSDKSSAARKVEKETSGYVPSTPEEIKRDQERAWEYVQRKYNKKKP